MSYDERRQASEQLVAETPLRPSGVLVLNPPNPIAEYGQRALTEFMRIKGVKIAIQPAISPSRLRVRIIDERIPRLDFMQLLATLKPDPDPMSTHGSVFIDFEDADEAVGLIEAALS